MSRSVSDQKPSKMKLDTHLCCSQVQVQNLLLTILALTMGLHVSY